MDLTGLIGYYNFVAMAVPINVAVLSPENPLST